jgi:hypothetical protein
MPTDQAPYRRGAAHADTNASAALAANLHSDAPHQPYVKRPHPEARATAALEIRGLCRAYDCPTGPGGGCLSLDSDMLFCAWVNRSRHRRTSPWAAAQTRLASAREAQPLN